MSVEAENIFVSVGARIRSGDFNQALAAVEMFKKTVGNAAIAISNQFKKAFAGIAAVGEATDEIQHMGEVLGVSNNQIRAFRAVAKEADVDVAAFAKSMLHMSAAAAKYGSKDGKAQTAAFNALGISATDLNGELRDQPKLLARIAKATANMGAGEKFNALSDIFGAKGAQAMIPALAMGGDEILDLMQSAATRTKAFDLAMTRMAGTLKKLKTALSPLGDLFSKFIGEKGEAGYAVERLATAFQNLLKSKGVVQVVEALGRAFSGIVNAIATVVGWVAKLSSEHPGLVKISGVFAAIASSLGAIKGVGKLAGIGQGLVTGLTGGGGGVAGSAISSMAGFGVANLSGVMQKTSKDTLALLRTRLEQSLSKFTQVQQDAILKSPLLSSTAKDLYAKAMAEQAPAIARAAALDKAVSQAAAPMGKLAGIAATAAANLGLVAAAAIGTYGVLEGLTALMNKINPATAEEKAGRGYTENTFADTWFGDLMGIKGTAEFRGANPEFAGRVQRSEDEAAAKEKADAMRQAQANMAAMQSGLVPSSVTRGGGLQEIALPVGNDTYNITINAAPGMSSEALIAEMRKDIAGKQRAKMNDVDAIAKLQNGMRAAVNAREE